MFDQQAVASLSAQGQSTQLVEIRLKTKGYGYLWVPQSPKFSPQKRCVGKPKLCQHLAGRSTLTLETSMRLVVLILLYLQSSSVLAQTFTNSTGGPIPDGTALAANSYGAPLDVPIVVSGVANGTIDTLSVAFSANHSFVGDLEVTLLSPYGQEHLLFARTGATDNNGGSAANLVASNAYTFSDPATSNWWTAAGLADVNIPSSNARTVPSGGPGVSNPPAPTSLLAVFQRRPPNGTWKLRFRDGWQGDIGNVSSASITVTTTGDTRTVTKIEDTNDNDCSPTDCSLREAIRASSAGIVSVDRIEFARPFFDSPRRILLSSGLNYNPPPMFAMVGPGAHLLNLSGGGKHEISFAGSSQEFLTFSGLRMTDARFIAIEDGPLLSNVELAFSGDISLFKAEINDSSIHSNRAGSNNLQLVFESVLRRVTVSGNTADRTISASNITTLIDCTIVDNHVLLTGVEGVVRLQNTVIAGNRVFSGAQAIDIAGSFQSLGHNFIGNRGSVTTINQASDQTGTALAPLNPVLSPLSRHGGQIPVHVPLSGSPLLDKGRRLGTDERGVPVVDFPIIAPAVGGNNGDIGAVEFNPINVSNLNDSGPGSLRQILADAPSAPAVSDVVFGLILPPAAKITLTSGELIIDKNVSIHGPGARKLTISGNRQSRVLAVQPSARVSISGLSLADGNGIGATSNNFGGIVLSVAGSQLAMVNTVLRNGRADLFYGGWVLAGFGEFTNSAIIGTRNDALGVVDRGMLQMYRATVSGCDIDCIGAGGSSELSIIDSTLLAKNGNALRQLGRLFVRNTLFSGGLTVSGSASVFSGGHNLIGSTDSTAFTGTDQVGTSAAPIAARLSPLAYHGGLVPTHVPLAGSPALDKGRRSGADARGLRSFDIASIAAASDGDDSDIGAVEAQALFVNNTNDSGTGSLRQAVLDANSNGVALDDVLFNFPTLPSTIALQSRLPNPVSGGALNLLGPSAAQFTISGNSANQLFSFTAPGHLGMSGLSLFNFRGIDGPALEVYQTEVHLTEIEVRDNVASGRGGAMLIGDADAVIESSTFANNSATGNYGALAYLGSGSRLQIRSSTFSGNSGTNGSAIANVARDAGASVLELESVTLAENNGSAALFSLATSTGAATSSAQNTLFSGTASSIGTSGTPASFTSLGFNLSATSEPLLNQTTDRVNVNPNLGTLQLNGDGTRTHALIIPSAAIDAGISTTGLALDQSGNPRTLDLLSIANALGSDGTDIGAFELQTAPDNPPVLSLSPAVGTIIYSTSGTALPIAVTPSGGSGSGSGSGPGATTTVGACTITAGGAAFPTTTTAQLSFVGNTTTAQNLNLPNCVPQSTVTNATLICPVVRGTASPLTRIWTLNCPAMAAELIFRNGFEN